MKPENNTVQLERRFVPYVGKPFQETLSALDPYQMFTPGEDAWEKSRYRVYLQEGGSVDYEFDLGICRWTIKFNDNVSDDYVLLFYLTHSDVLYKFSELSGFDDDTVAAAP